MTKRLREYQSAAFVNFKVNEFLDYMMVATEDEKQMWIEVWSKNFAPRERFWNWVKEGECIRLCYKSVDKVHEHFCVSRFSSVKSEVPRMILQNPWLTTKKDKQIYRNADSTFWYLIFTRLGTPKDVQSFSQVSRTHYCVSRKNGPYVSWVNGILENARFYCNPFEGQPLWSQFLKLSGVCPVLWKTWATTDAKCFFYLVYAMSRYNFELYCKDFIFDEETWTVFKSDGKTRYIWSDSTEADTFHVKDCRGHQRAYVLRVPNHMIYIAECVMRNAKH